MHAPGQVVCGAIGKGIWMNKAITEGINFMPPAFQLGLDVWSSGDGTPGSDTYDGAPNAAFVPADADFGGCLELQKTSSVQKLRYMGQTPLQPGCYLQVKVRVKAISGNLPSVRVAGWAGGAGGAHVTGVTELAPAVTLTTYGQVVEVTGIVGSGNRGGVDMPWGRTAIYGHFGINLEGPSGGIVRVDDIEITDVTGVFLRDMLSLVDVRDYGAVGDGVTDDAAAFEAADAAAAGRRVFVPEGSYFLGETVNIQSEIEFEGTVSMPVDKMLVLTKNYNLPAYIAAFGNEETAFRKAFQALLNGVDHESLDLGGRKVSITAPIDMQAAVPNRSSYATRRVIRNGQLDAVGGPAWDTQTYTSLATYNPANQRTLSNVANVANIPIGARVTGAGVGREIYVRSKNVGAGEITLNAGLYDAAGTQVFTFHDYKYMLDFSGFSALSKFNMQNIEFQCNNTCSGIKLAPAGATFALFDCFISRPKDRGITSIGGGCQGMLIDGCQFLSSEEGANVADRTSIAFNVNANDVKLRHNRATNFLHFGVMAGQNHMILGNHFFQGDAVPNGPRTAGIVIIGTYSSCTFAENYVDNCSFEWTNEQDANPDFSGGFSFSSMSITDNIFLSGEVAPWFSYVVIKPHGVGHFINGMTVTGNKFRSINGYIDRADRVDTSFSGLNYDRTKNLIFEGNMYHGVSVQSENPLRLEYQQATASDNWLIDTEGKLPFGAESRGIQAVVAQGALTDSGGAVRYLAPYAQAQQGAGQNMIRLRWSESVKGTVIATVRADK